MSCLQNCISAGEVTAREADLAGSPAADRVHWADCNDFVFLKADATPARAPHHDFTVREPVVAPVIVCD